MAAFGLDSLAIEIDPGADPLTASPTWVDITSDVRFPVVSQRGRSSVSRPYDSGVFTANLDNLSGDYDPENTAGTYTPDFHRGIPFRMTAEYNSTTYPVFWGHISLLPRIYVAGGDATVMMEAAENLGLIRTSRLQAVSYSQESTDTRLGNILDDVGWAAGSRDLDTGVADAAAITYTGVAGDLIDDTVEAEQGRFFIARDGDATFYNRDHYAAASPAATFGPGGGELSFNIETVATDNDDAVVNLAEITGADDSPQTSSDSTSINTYGEISRTSENLSIIDAANALNVAEWMTGLYATPLTFFPSIVITPQKDPTNLWPEVLGRELGDVIRVKHTPPAGDQVSVLVSVEAIQHELIDGLWRTTYGLAPLSDLATTVFWILGTSDLDTETVLV